MPGTQSYTVPYSDFLSCVEKSALLRLQIFSNRSSLSVSPLAPLFPACLKQKLKLQLDLLSRQLRSFEQSRDSKCAQFLFNRYSVRKILLRKNKVLLQVQNIC